MTSASPKPPTVLEAILEWSESRPMWLRDGLRRIVQRQATTEQDLAELLALCLAEVGLSDDELTGPAAEPLSAAHLPSTPDASDSVTLASVSDVRMANQLSPDQTLTFASAGLTVIYGDNASGKSGYARILKRACRARSRGEAIEPNIYGSPQPSGASATIAYHQGRALRTAPWTDGNASAVPELSAVSVFDEDCAAVHVEKKNEVAFTPFGLDVPERLASLCTRIKSILDDRRAAVLAERPAAIQQPKWSPTTTAGRMLAALSHQTQYDRLEALSVLSDHEKVHLAQLREDLAKDPAAAAKDIRLRVDRLKIMLAHLQAAEAALSEATVSALNELVLESRRKREIARLAADKLFSQAPLAGIGADAWRDLWEAARRYSEADAYATRPFPVTDDDARCVLCQQPLAPDAVDRLRQFEEFIKADTERQARQAQASAKTAWNALRQAACGTTPARNTIRELAQSDPSLAADVKRTLVIARLRRRHVLRAIDNKSTPEPLDFPESPGDRLGAHIRAAEARAAQLEQTSTDAARTKLKAEYLELHDREVLATLLPDVESEIARLVTLRAIDHAIAATNTRPITELGTKLAEGVLTPQLRDRFADELIRLAENRIRAELAYAGGKAGIPQYQVKLLARPGVNVARILSEGELTCVALASFLTELATAEHKSTLVFDDPVCSLDHRWRKRVAARLVDEGAARQIVVFTHDIVFVHDLHDLAQDAGVPCELCSLRRDSTGTGVVDQGLPWIGKRVEQRLDELAKRARAANNFYEAQQEVEYNREVESIYSDLRATWERSLEEVAFQRIVVRHRDYVDSKHLKKVSVLTEADCEEFRRHYKRCCDIVNSHDRSAARNAEHPPPDDLLEHINALEEWVTSLRERQKVYN